MKHKMLFKEPVFVERKDSQNNFKSQIFKIIMCNIQNFNFQSLNEIVETVNKTQFKDKQIVQISLGDDQFEFDCFFRPEPK